jgi:hypothetical protein
MRRSLARLILPFAVLSLNCGLFSGVCNDFCDFQEECADESGPSFCNEDLDNDTCVDACNKVLDDVDESQRDALDECMECVGDLKEDRRCSDYREECSSCRELLAASDGFLDDFFNELGDGDCYECEYCYDDYEDYLTAPMPSPPPPRG